MASMKDQLKGKIPGEVGGWILVAIIDVGEPKVVAMIDVGDPNDVTVGPNDVCVGPNDVCVGPNDVCVGPNVCEGLPTAAAAAANLLKF